jgi:hypothetical protein
VRFGRPIWADARPSNAKAHVRELTEQLMGEIADLSGQEYAPTSPATSNSLVSV